MASSFAALAKLKPAVRPTLPPAWFFKIPPSQVPATLPVPLNQPSLAHPFTIPSEIYNAALEPAVPFTVAIVYITVIAYLNNVNKRRNNKPWAFSKTNLFKGLVLAHNAFLALYSAWTAVGMFNALKVSLYNPFHEFGIAGTVDSLCKINGPRGLGSSARFNEDSTAWSIANRAFHLGADGLTPDSTDIGRMWNEGLAFYGWLFYLSKFYEVIDTLIIITKGKRSSTLQTYHHAGAMICMWAGIRYMSPPIWMFVQFNSVIHAMMYTFYLCSALRIPISTRLKRTLTTMQISQFVIGASFAFAHFFVKYQAPVSIPYTFHFNEAVSTIASDLTSAASLATASASADVMKYAKKALLRAAGREGLAQNVMNEKGEAFGLDAKRAVQAFARREETRYKDELQWTHCLDTSGQAFAIYINVFYLLPLTALFVRFFIKSYTKRLERRRNSTIGDRVEVALQSGRSAAHGVSRRASSALASPQGPLDSQENAVISDSDFSEAADALRTANKKAHSTINKAKKTASSVEKSFAETTRKVMEDVSSTVNDG